MRSYLKYFLAGFALVALALPAWSRTEQMNLNVQPQGIMIGHTQIPAGSYELRIDSSKMDLTVLKEGKVVTDAHGEWVKLPAKADDSEVMYDGNRLVQVQFERSNEAFHIG